MGLCQGCPAGGGAPAGALCGSIPQAWRLRGLRTRRTRRSHFPSRSRVAVKRVRGTLGRHPGIDRLHCLSQARSRGARLAVRRTHHRKPTLMLAGSRGRGLVLRQRRVKTKPEGLQVHRKSKALARSVEVRGKLRAYGLESNPEGTFLKALSRVAEFFIWG